VISRAMIVFMSLRNRVGHGRSTVGRDCIHNDAQWKNAVRCDYHEGIGAGRAGPVLVP
jgi:hypothetical protein